MISGDFYRFIHHNVSIIKNADNHDSMDSNKHHGAVVIMKPPGARRKNWWGLRWLCFVCAQDVGCPGLFLLCSLTWKVESNPNWHVCTQRRRLHRPHFWEKINYPQLSSSSSIAFLKTQFYLNPILSAASETQQEHQRSKHNWMEQI